MSALPGGGRTARNLRRRSSAAIWTLLLSVFSVGLLYSVPGCKEGFSVDADVLRHHCTLTRAFTWYDAQGVQRESLVDLVQSMGDGERFLVSLLSRNGLTREELLDPATDPVLLKLFDAVDRNLAAGGGFRALGQVPLSIQRRKVLTSNYEEYLESVGEVSGVPGEASLSVLFVPKPGRGSALTFRLVVSAEAGREGFLLGWDEFQIGSLGEELRHSSMRVTSLDYGVSADLPVHSAAQKSRRTYSSLEDLVADASAEGIPIFLPVGLPRGYSPVMMERTSIETDATLSGDLEFVPFYLVRWSDGLDWVEVLQSPPTAFSRLTRDAVVTPLRTELFVGVSDFYGVYSASVPQGDFEVTVEGRDQDRVLRSLRSLQLAIP